MKMMAFKIGICIFFGVVASQKNKMYVRKARMLDQIAEAAGYEYHSDLEGPSSYVHYSGYNYGYPPITVSHYTQEIPESYESFKYYYPDYDGKYVIPSNNYILDGIAAVDAEAQKLSNAYDQDLYASRYYNYGNDGIYDLSKYSNLGGAGDIAYKNNEAFNKGIQGKHNIENNKGYYDKNNANKENHFDNSGYYGSKNEAAKGVQGGSFSASNTHNEGSKTTGYHKVFHKDEFKKDHTFYDENSKKEHVDKYGAAHSQKADVNGAFGKGGRSEAGFQEAAQGAKGGYDKGYYDSNDNKFIGQAGSNVYHNNQENFAQNGGWNDGSSLGYIDKPGFYYY